MAKKDEKEDVDESPVEESAIAKKLAPQGSVIPEVPRTASGTPIVTASTGYDGHYPVQFENEADEDYAGRVYMFESAYANSLKGSGAERLEAAKSALQRRYELDLKGLEKQFIGSPTNDLTPPTANSRVVESEDGSKRGVDADYKLKKGEKFV